MGTISSYYGAQVLLSPDVLPLSSVIGDEWGGKSWPPPAAYDRRALWLPVTISLLGDSDSIEYEDLIDDPNFVADVYDPGSWTPSCPWGPHETPSNWVIHPGGAFMLASPTAPFPYVVYRLASGNFVTVRSFDEPEGLQALTERSVYPLLLPTRYLVLTTVPLGADILAYVPISHVIN